MSNKFLNTLNKVNNTCTQVFFYLYFFITINYLYVNNRLIELYYFLGLYNLSKNIKNRLLIYGGFNEEEEEVVEEVKIEEVIEKKPEIKYEDKYLDDIIKMRNEYSFTWEEIKIRDEKYSELLNFYKVKLLNEKHELNKTIVDLSLKYMEIDSNEYENNEECENSDDFYDVSMNTEKKEKLKNDLEEEINKLRLNLTKLEEKSEKELADLVKKESQDYIIKEHLDNLKNNFIIEKTPLGNVLMYYNNSRGSFEYYSDNTIPYRFLEVVGRKYVKTFKCKQIFVDMNFELDEFKKKLNNETERLKLEKIEKDMEEKKEEVKKKDVFAKFKNYNKEAGTGRVNRGVAPPKNSIPNNKTKASESVILKDNANRYTCEGRMSNFNFLKKQDRKKIDKK